MAKLRIAVIEFEGETEAPIVETVRAALARPASAPPQITERVELPRELPEPSLAPPPPPITPPAALHPAKSAPAAAAPESPTPTKTGKGACKAGDGTIKGSILAALGKKPMSTIELTEFTRLEMSQVSPACSALKADGRIDGKTDDERDGVRRWFLKS